jgi:methyl-accepting chemotaxis protein
MSRSVQSFGWHHRLGARLTLALGAASAVLLAGLLWFSVSMYGDEREARLRNNAEKALAVLNVVEQVDQSGRRGAERLYAELEQLLPPVALTWAEVDGKPKLMSYGQPLEGDYSALDLFTQRTGAVATVFQREGDDFRRISTSLTKEDGSRAVGTLLGSSHPAYQPLMQGQPYVGRAVLFGRTYMTKYQPVRINGQVRAVLFIGYDLGTEFGVLRKVFQSMSTGSTVVAALDMGTRRGQWTGVDWSALPQEHPLLAALQAPIDAGETEGHLLVDDVPGLAGEGPVHVSWRYFAPWKWAVLTLQRHDDLMRSTVEDLWRLWLTVAISGVLIVGLMYVVLRRDVLRPVQSVLAAVETLGQGRLDQPLTRTTPTELGQVQSALEALRQQWGSMVVSVQRSAEGVANASAEIAQGNQDLSARTESAAASLEQTTASTQHLTETVRHSAEAARTANQLAAQAAQVARDGGQTVSQAVQSMKAIESSSQKIADITNVIDGIAFQTNILALNAAVEAARAGEAGRGFAVVAGEVRSLAQRSAEAAKQIKALIDESVATVRTGSTQVDSAGQTMEQIVQSIQRVADMIAEVTAAANEQSDSIAQVNAALGQLDQTTQQNAALVEEAAAAAQSLRQQAAELQQVVSQFRTGVGDGGPMLIAAK